METEFKLRSYQETAVANIRTCYMNKKKAPLFVLPTGGGKCLGRGTPIMMFNGEIQPVESIKIGDLLMGPDSYFRKVESVTKGVDQLYKITPIKGDSFICNQSHILSLINTTTDNIINISITDYLKQSKNFKHLHKLYRVKVNFKNEWKSKLSPYFIGIWLGDGNTSNSIQIHKPDDEIIYATKEEAKKFNLNTKTYKDPRSNCKTTTILGGTIGRGHHHPLKEHLDEFGFGGEKKIPDWCLYTDEKSRLELLAGLIDTDGYYGHNFDFSSSIESIADSVLFLSRSLGFAAYKFKKIVNNKIYWRVSISGKIEKIPTRIERKKAKERKQIKDALRTGFKIDPIGEGEYFGFELSGNDRLFLLGDFTVTHNTVIFSYVAKSAISKSNNVFILVHRKELLMQASRSLSRLGVMHGLISAQTSISNHKVQIASVQTLSKRLNKINIIPDLIIIDEAHHSCSKTYLSILNHYNKARVLGVTATPIRSDGKGLNEVFDDIVLGPSISELISQGNLVQPIIYAPPVGIDLEKLNNTKKSMGDFDKKLIGEQIDKPSITGSAAEHYLKYCKGEPAIVFCISILHAEHVASEFKAAGIKAIHVDGKMNDEDRKNAIDGLGNGTYDVVTSADLIGEGVDIPRVSAVILLRPTHSLSLYIQQVGRALRPYPGKTRALVLDHVGNVMRHGFPDDDREWSLEGEVRNKRKKEEMGIKIIQCLYCFAVYERGPSACPECDRAPEMKVRRIEEKEGELKKLTKEEIKIIKKQNRREQGKAQTYEELIAIGRARGMNNPSGWAYNLLKSRQKKRA